MNRKRKLIATVLAIVIMVTPLLPVIPVAAEEQPIPKLTFSGIEISQAADNSYQAVYSLRLENADAASVGFTLSYDDTCLQPSSFDDNSLFSNEDILDAFKINGEPRSRMFMEFNGNLYCNVAYTTDAMTGSQEGGVLVGQFSFRLKDGKFTELGGMTRSDLSKIVALNDADSIVQPLQVTYVDEDANGGYRVYDDVRWSTRIDFKPVITSVTANITPGRETVSAQAIYQDNAETDLFQYVKDNSTSVTVTYLDGNTGVVPFTWSVEDMALSPDGTTWDARGGTYTVIQEYLDTGLNVEAEIEVTPVNVSSFAVTPAALDYITYDTDADPTCKPADMSDAKMQLPTQAIPTYDTLLVNGYTAAPVNVNNDWTQTDPDSTSDDFFAADAKGEYTFQASVDTTALPAWATVPGDLDAAVAVKRFVGPPTATPDDITATVDDNGNLIITVNKLGDDQIPDGTKFFVRLPDGTDVTIEDSYIAIADGVATITIPNSAIPTPKTGQMINLGADATAPFQVAAQVTDPELMGRSDFTDLTFAPRNNYYDLSSHGRQKDFSYTGTDKGKFPFPVGTVLPLEITLPGTDYVETTYDGVTGADGGKLQTIKVSEWTLTSGDPSKAGERVTYTGILVDNTVSGYGDVKSIPGVPQTVLLNLETVEPQTYSVVLKTDPADGSLGVLTFADGTSGPADIAENSTVQLKCAPVDGYSVTWETVPAGIQITQDSEDDTLFSFTMPGEDVTITAKIVDSSTLNAGTLGFYGKTKDEPTEEVPDPAWVDTLIDTLYTTDGFDDDHKLTADSEHPTAFDPEVPEYWMRVSNATEQLKIEMTAPGAGGVLLVYEPGADGSFPDLDSIDPATATEGTGGLLRKVAVSANDPPATDYSAAADAIPLAPAVEGSTNDFFVVMVGGAKSGYTVHVQRMAKAEIKLAYGNSPYGMIMADDAITDKDGSKQAFVNNSNQFSTTNLPADGDMSVIYQLQAWGSDDTAYDDPDVNLDRNDHAIFVYNKEDFVDPGFTARDSLGNIVQPDDVSREFKADIMHSNGLGALNDDAVTSEAITVLSTDENGRDTYDMTTQAYGVRPGIYKIVYRFVDPNLPATDEDGDGKPDNEIVEERYVAVLNVFGDADNDCARGDSDASATRNIVAGRLVFVNYNERYQALFRYRVVDADNDNAIGDSDATAVQNVVAGRTPALRFYKSLGTEE